MTSYPKNKEITTDDLLAYLAGEAEVGDATRVEVWLEESAENRKTFESLFRDYLLMHNVQRESRIDASGARKRFLSMIRGRRRRLIYRRMAAAAGVALIFSIALWMLYPVKTEKAPLASIIPGKTQARLTLPSGEIYQLSGAPFSAVSQEGTRIVLDSTLRIEPPEAASGESVEPNHTIVVPRGGEFSLTLSDGSNVWLNADSELQFPAQFSGPLREVALRGEAYFEVVPGSAPFRVLTGGSVIQVYGTAFNVNAYRTAEVEVALVSGSVGFRATAEAQEHLMQSNQLLTADLRHNTITLINTDLTPHIAWRNNDMIFVNEPLESIMEKIARWYDVEVLFCDEAARDVRFYGDIKRYADIQEVLNYLQRTSSVAFEINGRIIEIRNK